MMTTESLVITTPSEKETTPSYWSINDEWHEERESFYALPSYVILDVQAATEAYAKEQSLVKAFQFCIDDLIDDCLNAIVYRQEAPMVLAEYIDSLLTDLEVEGWADQGTSLLSATYELGFNLMEQLDVHQLYSRSGVCYYKVKEWLEPAPFNHTLVLEKVNHGEFE